MNDNVSFIGTGNMGGALIRAACRVHDPKLVHITNRSMDKARSLADELGCSLAASNRDAVLAGEYIFLCVKPQMMGELLSEIHRCSNHVWIGERKKYWYLLRQDLKFFTLKSSWPCAAMRLRLFV